jgi:photosystem II stability/assembly factor-like uncharacterized protein
MAQAKAKTRRHAKALRPVRAPAKRQDLRRLPRWAYLLGATSFVALVASGAFLLGKDKAQSGSEGWSDSASGLPKTADYHSLLIAPTDPRDILLGTHAGLYESLDGGRSWKQVGLAGQDAMNLARTDATTVWAAGHDLLARSTDGGATWSDVRPQGLPSRDIHGFAVDPRDGSLWAAVAGRGLYHSADAVSASSSSRTRSAAT